MSNTLVRRTSATTPAALFSLIFHAMILLVATISVGRGLAPGSKAARERALDGVIWMAQPSQGGEQHGGGGGGNRQQAPPRRVELPGSDVLTVAVERPARLSLQPPAAIPADVAPPIVQLDIAALRTAAGTETLPGAIDGVPNGASQGPGSGGGAGSGDGLGDGPGRGPGRGPGSGGNEGGGPRDLATPGLQIPRLVRAVRPAYTAEAMHARIQGTVAIDCVVRADGTVSDLRVVRSLDAVFGLDAEAVKAARQWLFIPGRLRGQPVPVLVRLELSFSVQ